MTDRRPSTRASPPYAAVVGRLLPMLKVGKGPVEARMRPGITPCVTKPAATYAAATPQFHSPAASADA